MRLSKEELSRFGKQSDKIWNTVFDSIDEGRFPEAHFSKVHANSIANALRDTTMFESYDRRSLREFMSTSSHIHINKIVIYDKIVKFDFKVLHPLDHLDVVSPIPVNISYPEGLRIGYFNGAESMDMQDESTIKLKHCVVFSLSKIENNVGIMTCPMAKVAVEEEFNYRTPRSVNGYKINELRNDYSDSYYSRSSELDNRSLVDTVTLVQQQWNQVESCMIRNLSVSVSAGVSGVAGTYPTMRNF